MSTFRRELATAEDAMATASGTATLAVEGHREAICAWAAIVGAYLRRHTANTFSPTSHGFPEPYDDADARACLLRLVEAFDRIRAGEEPNRALGWNTGKKGRPSKVRSNRRRALLDDWKLQDVQMLIYMGKTAREACETVAAAHADSPERLEQLHKRSL